MKRRYLLRFGSCLSLVLLLAVSACDKQTAVAPPPRTVTYVLYTEQNFSTVQDTIRFRLLMKAGDHTLLDSSLGPRRVSEVPGPSARITIQKTGPEAYRNSDLLVGFIYDIDNVGESWFLDSSRAGNLAKTVEYSFK